MYTWTEYNARSPAAAGNGEPRADATTSDKSQTARD